MKELVAADEDYLRTIVAEVVEAMLEAEMAEALAASKGERMEGTCAIAPAITSARW